MPWIPVTTETSLPAGTELLALRRRDPWDERKGWRIIEPVTVQRVGTIAGESHPEADALSWYGHNYQSSAGSRPWDFYSHYLLLDDLPGLPPLPEPTPEDAAHRWAFNGEGLTDWSTVWLFGYTARDGQRVSLSWEGDPEILHFVALGTDKPPIGSQPVPEGATLFRVRSREDARRVAAECGGLAAFGMRRVRKEQHDER